MKTNKKDLAAALARVSPITDRQFIPILNSIHVSAANGYCSLRAVGGDQEMKEVIPCEGGLEPFCILPNKLTSLLDGASDSVEITLANNRMTFRSASRVSHCAVLDEISSFPPETTHGAKLIGLNCADLAKGINSVRWLTPGKKEDRMALFMVHVKTSAREIVCETANGRELSRFALSAIAAPCDMCIPTEMSGRVASALIRDGAQLLVSENRVVVQHDHGSYSCKLYDGVFPETKRVSASPQNRIGLIKRAELLTDIRQCIALTMGDRLCSVVMEFGDGLAITFRSSENEHRGWQEGKFEPFKAHMNGRALAPVLESFDGEDILVSLSEMNEALVLSDADYAVWTIQIRPEVQP